MNVVLIIVMFLCAVHSELFGKCDTKSRLELLDSNLALGDWRHRFEINRMAHGIREGIAFIIFAISAQQDLVWKETLRYMPTQIIFKIHSNDDLV